MKHRRLTLVCACAAAVMSVYIAVVYLLNWYTILSIPAALGYEGNILWDCWYLSQGANLYDPARLVSMPWLVTIYPPGFFIVGALLCKIFGPAFWYLRLLTVVGTIATIAGLWRLLQLSGCSLLIRVTIIIYFLCLEPVALMSASIRMDMVALAFSVWALERFFKNWLEQDDSKHLRLRSYLSTIILCVLGVVVKQQAVVVPLGIFFFLVLAGRRVLAAKFLLSWLTATMAVFLCFQFETNGFFSHISFVGASGWQAGILQFNILGLRRQLPKILAGLFLIGLSMRHRLKDCDLLPLGLGASSVCILLYSMGIPASAINHAIPTLMAFGWFVGSRLKNLPAIFCVLMISACTLWPPAIGSYTIVTDLLARTQSELKKLTLNGTWMLTEDPSLAIATGANCVIVDQSTFRFRWGDLRDKYKPIVEDIRHQKYSAIAINYDDSLINRQDSAWASWPPEVVLAINERYHKAAAITGNGYVQALFLPGTRTK